MPDFLLAARNEAAQFANMDPSRPQQVLLTQYPPGAAVGWHKDPLSVRTGGRDFAAVSLHVPI
jgi:alkylated DNA repair dioxygenase AlkB